MDKTDKEGTIAAIILLAIFIGLILAAMPNCTGEDQAIATDNGRNWANETGVIYLLQPVRPGVGWVCLLHLHRA